MTEFLEAQKKFGLESLVSVLIALHLGALLVWLFLLARGGKGSDKSSAALEALRKQQTTGKAD